MKPELKARLARLGPIRDVPRVSSGAPADVVLRPDGALADVHTIKAIHALVARHVPGRAAMAAIDTIVMKKQAVVEVPMIEPGRGFAREMKAAGVRVTRLAPIDRADVRAIRERLGLTAVAFAKRFSLNPRTVEGWEQGRPIDEIANAYLHAIAVEPETIARSFESEMA